MSGQKTSTGKQVAITKKLKWSPEATATVKLVVLEHTQDLTDEAERVAQRAGASVVAVGYVEQAALTVRMGRTSQGCADVMLSIGTAVGGVGGGALVSAATAMDVAGWLVPVSYGLLLVGVAMSAVGGTVKWVRR